MTIFRIAPLAGVALVLLTGCSDEELTQPGPDPEPEGVTFQMTTTLEPGTEAEHCKFVRGPAEGMLVNRDRIDYTEGSHHFLLYTTPYADIPTEDDEGNPIDYLDPEQGVFDCSEGVQFGYSVQQLVGGSQNANGDSMVDFPDGVAMRVPPNAVLLMNAHYINASSDALEPVVDVTLETITEDELEQEGSVLFWYNPFIKVPGQGTAFATTICDLPDDVTLTSAQSHMHARGVDYTASLLEPGGDRNEIYRNTEWEDVPVEQFADGLAIEGGSRIEYTCHYDNPGMDDIYQGPRSTDEMCMFIGSYYPSEPGVDLCSGRADAPYETTFFGGEWVGQGQIDCADSMACFQTALVTGSQEPIALLAEVTECVLSSDPAVSPELSEVIGCTFSSFITGGNGFADCQEPIDACSAK